MRTIYWIEVLGNFEILCVILLIIALAGLAVMSGFLIAESIDGPDDEDTHARLVKNFKILVATSSILSLFCVFVPSPKQMMLIYGLGGTIDYIQSNDKAKQLPDKVVDALTRYVDHIEQPKTTE